MAQYPIFVYFTVYETHVVKANQKATNQQSLILIKMTYADKMIAVNNAKGRFLN
jgi:hypothetical protein